VRIAHTGPQWQPTAQRDRIYVSSRTYFTLSFVLAYGEKSI